MPEMSVTSITRKFSVRETIHGIGPSKTETTIRSLFSKRRSQVLVQKSELLEVNRILGVTFAPMKIVAIASFALLLVAGTSRAMVPGMSEVGRHFRSLPTIGTQSQDNEFKGDILAPENGPMLAPFMPWHPSQNGPMLAPFMPWHPSQNGPMLAPFMPWHPSQNGSMLAPFMPWRPTAVC